MQAEGELMPQLILDDFSGGFNNRDDAAALHPTEMTTGSADVRVDENNALALRSNHATWTDVPAVPAGTVAAFFYSSGLNLFFVQVGTQLYSCAPGGGAWVARGAVFGSTAPIAMVDFGQYAVYCHPVSGTFTIDAAFTVTNRSATVKGSCIAVWQNCVWVGGDPTDNNTKSRLYRSAIGDATVYAVASGGLTVDLKEKDSEILTALQGGGALLVFKKRSAYRVNDANTGSFVTLDWASGCIGQFAVAALDGLVYSWGADGIYRFDGVGPAVNVGDKIRSDILGVTGTVIAAAFSRRVFFCTIDANYGNYEFDPRTKSIVVHAFAVADLAGIALYSSKPRAVSTDGTRTTLFDAGNAETVGGNWRSPIFAPGQSRRVRFRRLSVTGTLGGTGALNLDTIVHDDTDHSGASTTTTFALGLASTPMNMARVQSLGQGHSIQFYIYGVGSVTSWRIRRLVLDYEVIER